MKTYDAIIVGAGHNGLVTAFYLAKAGKSVLLLEKNSVLGGGAITEEFHSGFKVSSCAYECSGLNPKIINDLALTKNGLEFVETTARAVNIGKKPLVFWKSEEKLIAEIAKFSEKDAKIYPKYSAFMKKIARLFQEIFFKIPPNAAPEKINEFIDLASYWLKLRKVGKKDMMEVLRIPPMSIKDFLDEWFECETLKATLAAKALRGNALGPYSPGTAFLSVYDAAISTYNTTESFAKGGMGSIVQAMLNSLKKYSVETRTGTEVTEIVVENGKACGVKLRDGEQLQAKVIISNTDPQTTFSRLVAPINLSPKFRGRIEAIKMQGVNSIIHFALKELPKFEGLDAEQLRSEMYIAPDMDYIEKAFDHTKYGGFSQAPMLTMTIPSLHDPSLAPSKQHCMSVLVQYTPYHLKDSDWQQQSQALSDLVVGKIAEYSKNFAKLILHTQTLTPVDLEKKYGFNGGHILHGDHTLDQAFLMRPVPDASQYATPIENLYLCGAGTHPGGGITGIPGYNSAHKVLKNWPR